MTDDLLLKIAEAIMVHYGQVCMSRELAEMIGDVNARRRDGQPITSAELDLIDSELRATPGYSEWKARQLLDATLRVKGSTSKAFA
jgi:hypothetical protein